MVSTKVFLTTTTWQKCINQVYTSICDCINALAKSSLLAHICKPQVSWWQVEPNQFLRFWAFFSPAGVLMSFDMLLVVDAVLTNSCQSGDLTLDQICEAHLSSCLQHFWLSEQNWKREQWQYLHLTRTLVLANALFNAVSAVLNFMTTATNTYFTVLRHTLSHCAISGLGQIRFFAHSL